LLLEYDQIVITIKFVQFSQLVKDVTYLRLLFEDQRRHQGEEGDKKENLLAFLHAWTNNLIASGLEHKEERDNIAILTADVQFAAENKIFNALERHLISEMCVIYTFERAIFNTVKQKQDETTDEYLQTHA
jgi:hypothetical protein